MIQLLEHFTYKKLIRFTIPTVAMMIFTSIYGVVDGLFVSKTIGEGNKKLANRYFSMLIYFLLIVGIVLSILGNVFIRQISELLGARAKWSIFAPHTAELSSVHCRFLCCKTAFRAFL